MRKSAWPTRGISTLGVSALALPVLVGLGSPALADTEPAEQEAQWCAEDDLEIVVAERGAAAGTDYIELAITNPDGESSEPCQMVGYANMHWVDSPDGEMVGDWATHDGDGSTEPFLLQPGEAASVTVAQPTVDNYPEEECDPQPVSGMAVMVDDDVESGFAYVDTGGMDRACANPDVGQPRLSEVTPPA